MKFSRSSTARLLWAVTSVAVAAAAPARGDSCQFGAGPGNNAACASGPDSYSDIYGPVSPGYAFGYGFGPWAGAGLGPGLWIGGLVPSNTGPGVSAGVGTGRVTGPGNS